MKRQDHVYREMSRVVGTTYPEVPKVSEDGHQDTKLLFEQGGTDTPSIAREKGQ